MANHTIALPSTFYVTPTGKVHVGAIPSTFYAVTTGRNHLLGSPFTFYPVTLGRNHTLAIPSLYTYSPSVVKFCDRCIFEQIKIPLPPAFEERSLADVLTQFAPSTMGPAGVLIRSAGAGKALTCTLQCQQEPSNPVKTVAGGKLSPTRILKFPVSDGTEREVYEFVGADGVGKGTIGLFLGGLPGKTPTGVFEVRTKGFDFKDDPAIGKIPINDDELTFLRDIRDQGWRILMFKFSQTFGRDGTISKEFWLNEYVNFIVNTFPLSTRWVFAGHSAGAYIVGAHIQHLQEGISTQIPRNVIMSYPFALGDPVKKTVFTSAHFNGRTTLFISGVNPASGANEIDIQGYQPTKDLREIACMGISRHGWIALNGGHEIFKRINPTTRRRAVTDIIDQWYTTSPPTVTCIDCSEPVVNCN